MRDYLRQQLWQPWFYEQMVARYRPFVTTPINEPTMAATDLAAGPSELPPPPSEMVCDDIDRLIADNLASNGYARVSKTRFARMKSRFKALVGEWFTEYVDLYFPEDTHHLISSYMETFRRALALGKILIQSDLFYAGIVEQMENVEWQKGTTKDHAVACAKAEIDQLIPEFLDQARGFALE